MTPITTLETARFTLRKPIPSDWEPFKALCMSDRAKGIGGPFSHRKAWRQFAAEFGHWEIHGFGMFTVTEKGDTTPLGLIGPWYPDDWPETEIGWMVFDGAEGKGIAYEAARACVIHAYDNLGWETVVSYISKSNLRSIALAERLGAKLDPAAPQPHPEDPCLVYRHAPREALQ